MAAENLGFDFYSSTVVTRPLQHSCSMLWPSVSGTVAWRERPGLQRIACLVGETWTKRIWLVNAEETRQAYAR